jgi:hypothetical protein
LLGQRAYAFVILTDTDKSGILWSCLSPVLLPTSVLALFDLCQSGRWKNSTCILSVAW